MIDFDRSRRPSRPCEWEALANAVYNSAASEESHWLELKGSLDWSKGHDLGIVARAIIGMANRDPASAAVDLGGTGVVLVGVGSKVVSAVAVIDATDVENKLSPYLGDQGLRWQPHFVTVDGQSALLIEVDAPKNGDPHYTLRKSFSDFKVSQTFVRNGSKTEPASEADIQRLARRVTASETSADALDVLVEYELDETLSKVYINETVIEGFLRDEERTLLASLERAQEPKIDPIGLASGLRGVDSVNRSIAMMTPLGDGLSERKEEDRTPEAYRAEVANYIEQAKNSMGAALSMIAQRIVPLPRFLLSNLSDRNFKHVDVTIRVEGDAEALDYDGDMTTLRSLLPKRPRDWEPYTATSRLAHTFRPRADFPGMAASIQHNLYPSRREIRNGGSFELNFHTIDVRPREKKIEAEANTVILIPRNREEPVVVHWRATASNVDAYREGEFVLPFDGDPIDLASAAIDEA